MAPEEKEGINYIEPAEVDDTPTVEGEETTAEAAPEEVVEESAPSEPESPEPSGVQKRIDELTWRVREAERQRDRAWEVMYEQQRQPAPPEPQAVPQPVAKPRYEDFESEAEYFEAVAEYKAEQIWQKRETERQQREQQAQMQAQRRQVDDWHSQGRSKYPDYDQVARREDIPVTEVMGQAILEEKMGHDVLYHLGKHPEEARRIANLQPWSQAREIGRLAARLESQAPKPKTRTSAPAPTQPVGGRDVSAKKIEDMTPGEYIAFMNQKEFGTTF